ncbi:MAG: riboflavin synthase subunit alpha [Myxococcota bacterium]
MFTGITRGLFDVVAVEREEALLRFDVQLGAYGEGLELGASVSIDGVCQTLVRWERGVARFEAIQETLAKTTLGELAVGAKVSVERSARVGDEIGGHDVAGHVTGTGTVHALRAEGHEVQLTVSVAPAWMRFLQPKGYVALDGSSLTIGDAVDEAQGRFDVFLIPETLARTGLGRKRPGDRINVELDPKTVAIVRTVERELARRGLTQGGVTD